MSLPYRAILAALALFSATLCQAGTLTVCIPANAFPPLTFADHEGQGQWLVRKAVERQGDMVRFEAVPWPRCTEGVLAGTYDAAMPPTAMFGATLALPMAGTQVDPQKAIGHVLMVVLRRVGSKTDWDGKAFSGLTRPVMFNRGVVSVREKLAKLGVAGDEGASQNDSLLRKLLAGRNELLIMNAQAAAEELAADEFRGKLEVLPTPFITMTMYIGFNRRYQATNAAYVEALWSEIARLRTTSEWQRLAPSLAK